MVLLYSMLMIDSYTIHVLKNIRMKQRIMLYGDANMMEHVLILISVTVLSVALDWTMMAMFTFYVLVLMHMCLS